MKVEMTVKNNTEQTICLNGDKYLQKIYAKNSKGTKYSSMNSAFDLEEIVLKKGTSKRYVVQFNKIYDSNNKINSIVFSDVIFNYDEYYFNGLCIPKDIIFDEISSNSVLIKWNIDDLNLIHIKKKTDIIDFNIIIVRY